MNAAPSPYLMLKLAQELCGKPMQALDDGERGKVEQVARRQAEIEARILATVEAAGVVLPAASVDQSVAQVRERYTSEDEFLADLARSDLTPDSLRAAIERDLVVEAVLERVAGRAEPASPTDVEIFYLQNRAKFSKPETRTLRHILVTINDTLAGNERAAAREKIEAIRSRLLKDLTRFAEQALKHSECPTAMNGGLLGTLPRGKLFAELDAVAFALPPGGLSAVAESPLGFHLILCEGIDPARDVPLVEAHAGVRRHLTESRRQATQKDWVKALFKRP